jgi:hypothetical protein
VEVLRGVHGGSCPGELNFHCHTLHSDGSLHPDQLASQAVAQGLRHFAVTDHHSTAALAPVQQCLGLLADQGQAVPHLWSGIEISCLLEGCLVHVLGLDFDPHDRALTPYRQGQAPVGPDLRAEEVVKRLHGAGGLALLAHPARYRKPFGLLIDAAAALGFDGAEAYYDYAMAPCWQPTPWSVRPSPASWRSWDFCVVAAPIPTGCSSVAARVCSHFPLLADGTVRSSAGYEVLQIRP